MYSLQVLDAGHLKMILSEVIEVCTEEQKCIVYCANNPHHTNI